ncbi:hypothetical protein BH18CHL2_BH18CHL2_05760 [soil metagenome]
MAVAVLREATGRVDPLPHVLPSRAATLGPGQRVAFWSLSAGVGTSTTAALLAHRSSAGGRPAVLFDLDRWAPSLALRAGIEAATIGDALLRPGRESELLSRWAATPFLPGTPSLHACFDAARVIDLVDRVAAGRPSILDLGSGADAIDSAVLARCDRLCVCVGSRAAQLQAAFSAVSLLRHLPNRTHAVIVGATDEDGRRIAGRLPWPLAATIPVDEYLARDEFACRAPTLRAVDALIRALA